MPTQQAAASPVQQIRLIHAALFAGVLIFAVVSLLVPLPLPPGGAPAGLGATMASAGVIIIALGQIIFRRSVPRRNSSQSPDEYWAAPLNRTRALVLWAIVEAGALVGVCGHLLTHDRAAMMVGVLGLFVLTLLRPSRLSR